MAQIEIKNLSFSYPSCNNKALNKIDLCVDEGEFILLSGKSGCGKTTLLRLLKNSFAPKGKLEGEILYRGKDIRELTLKEETESFGFVMQNPDSQIVTDKVWHELAFGLENIGLDSSTVSMRIGETASFFGMDSWFNKSVNEISGGQKQLLNLASVMLLNPQILLLDEPTSQLDPISAENFLTAVKKINKELGITVIITEHRLEDVFAMADRVVVMDSGEIVSIGTPREIGDNLENQPDFLKCHAPTPISIFAAAKGGTNCPLSVVESRKWLKTVELKSKDFTFVAPELSSVNAVELKNVCFAYGKNLPDVLSNLSLKVPENSIFAIMGATGVGKSTLIKVMSGILPAYKGSVKINGKKIEKYKSKELYQNNLAVLPQDVQALFVEATVRDDLESVSKIGIDEVCILMDISQLAESHPFDISGGEQQRAALAKVLLTNPKILIADEPTKGMDGEFKAAFGKILKELKARGCTVILVSHDIEFCAVYADKCALLFDGRISAVKDTHGFFADNRFYTTSANRISRGIADGVVTKEELLCCIKGEQ